jgi:hypothetical protein
VLGAFGHDDQMVRAGTGPAAVDRHLRFALDDERGLVGESIVDLVPRLIGRSISTMPSDNERNRSKRRTEPKQAAAAAKIPRGHEAA